jgi:hypothetical protein
MLDNVRDEKRRGVGGEDALGLGVLVEEVEQLLLDLQVLNDRLDDQVGTLDSLSAGVSAAPRIDVSPVGKRVDVAQDVSDKLVDALRRDPLGDARRRLLDNVDAVTLRQPRSAASSRNSLVVHVDHVDPVAGLGSDLDDAGTHEAGAEDNNSLDAAAGTLGEVAGDGSEACSRVGHCAW